MKKWNPIYWFLNDDHKRAPDDYMPDEYGIFREIAWLCRNPLHNFTFYVIGVADKDYTVIGIYPESVFNPEGGWKWHIVKYKWVRLPFISYIGKIKFYIGWRNRGNFGIKITNNKEQLKTGGV